MDKKEQIKAILKEWKEEDSEKRTYALVMIQVEKQDEEGYDTGVETWINGSELCLVDVFSNMLLDKRNYFHEILHKAIGRYMDKRLGDIFKKLTKELKDKLDKDKDNQNIN